MTKIGRNTGKRITNGQSTRRKMGRVIASVNKIGSGIEIGGTRGKYIGRAKYYKEETRR